jgi:mRNA-degrading endonuclease RelE of RelBE toxin-antitoxin system
MTLAEEIRKQLDALPPEKQSEVLDFIEFLKQRSGLSQSVRKRSLKKHAAFGSWKHRRINAIQYQQNLRAEWGN